MTGRLIVAYGLMLLMAVWLVAVILWKRYHSRERTQERQLAAFRKRELAAAKTSGEGSDQR